MISITNYEYDKYFIIAAWGESGGSCDAKKGTTKENKSWFVNCNWHVCLLKIKITNDLKNINNKTETVMSYGKLIFRYIDSHHH